MNPENANKDTIVKLKSLQAAFQNEAGRFKGYADTVSQIVDDLEAATRASEKAKKSEMLKNNADSFLLGLSVIGKPLKDKNILLLIDGSGSMQELQERTITMAQTMDSAVKGMSNVNVRAFMWGLRSHPVSINFDDDALLNKLAGGLNCQSDLAPTIKALGSANDLVGPASRDMHIIIISDGDLSDRFDAQKALGDLLRKDPKVTVDGVVIYPSRQQSRGYGSDMSGMLKLLAADENLKSRIGIHDTPDDNIMGAMTKVLVERAGKPAKKTVKAPKGPKKA